MNTLSKYADAMAVTRDAGTLETIVGTAYRAIRYSNGWVLRYDLNTLKFVDAVKIQYTQNNHLRTIYSSLKKASEVIALLLLLNHSIINIKG